MSMSGDWRYAMCKGSDGVSFAVRFGSLAEVRNRVLDVGFTPKNRLYVAGWACLLRAIGRHSGGQELERPRRLELLGDTAAASPGFAQALMVCLAYPIGSVFGLRRHSLRFAHHGQSAVKAINAMHVDLLKLIAAVEILHRLK